jgi:hypothetical protein
MHDALEGANMKLFLIGILIAVLVVSASAVPVTQTGTSQTGTLTMTKIVTSAVGDGACTMNVALPNGTITTKTGQLFTGIKITLNVTWTQSNSTYTVVLSNFYLVITQNNIVISNSTNVNQNQNPTNKISSVTLFPAIPVILIVSFKPVCLTAGSISRLIYIDGTFNFVYSLP